MKIDEKISLLKKTIQEIKKISKNLDDGNIYQKKIDDLNKELSQLKNEINQSVKELEEILEEENA